MLALLDLLGRRWALRILWELRLEPASFQVLQRRCDSMSTSVLSQRLSELTAPPGVDLRPRRAEKGARASGCHAVLVEILRVGAEPRPGVVHLK